MLSQAAIHLHALSLFNIRDYKQLNTVKCSLTQEEVDAYEQGLPNCRRPTSMEFTLDCSRDRHSLFNREAISVFSEDFVDKVRNHGWYRTACIPERYQMFEVVAEAFKAHFAYIKTRYREVVVAPSEDPIWAKHKLNLKLQKSSRGSRKVCVRAMYIYFVHPLI